MNTAVGVERYCLPARILHWAFALAIPCQIYLGWAAELAASRESGSQLIHLHYQIGITMTALMALRLTWRLAVTAPAPLHVESARQRRTAMLMHWALYGLLFLLPASGYVIWIWMEAPMDVFGLFEVPKLFTPPVDDETGRALAWYVHYWSGWTLIGLVTMHVGAALWHQFARHDRLISRRML